MNTFRLRGTSAGSMSIREMQAYGAACLSRFCAAKSISSPFVDELIEHLIALLISTDLPNWEAAGARLALAGRGDPLPEDLIAHIPPDLLSAFQRLVECVVEIGLINLYGAETKEPIEFADRATAILKSNGIAPPAISELLLLVGRRNGGWDIPLSFEQFQRVRKWCLRA